MNIRTRYYTTEDKSPNKRIGRQIDEIREDSSVSNCALAFFDGLCNSTYGVGLYIPSLMRVTINRYVVCYKTNKESPFTSYVDFEECI